MADETFTGKLTCPHCKNSAPMAVVAKYDRIVTYGSHPYEAFDTSVFYEVLKCPACDEVLLQRYFWNDMWSDPADVSPEILYPCMTTDPSGLPSKISKAYKAAQNVRNIDANAYAVLIRRVLELVCSDRNAKGKTLAIKLRDLADQDEIPQKLVSVASGLRAMGNIGAHADAGDLTDTEIPIIDKLCAAILDYVYSAPLLAQQASELLSKLKAKQTA